MQIKKNTLILSTVAIFVTVGVIFLINQNQPKINIRDDSTDPTRKIFNLFNKENLETEISVIVPIDAKFRGNQKSEVHESAQLTIESDGYKLHIYDTAEDKVYKINSYEYLQNTEIPYIFRVNKEENKYMYTNQISYEGKCDVFGGSEEVAEVPCSAGAINLASEVRIIHFECEVESRMYILDCDRIVKSARIKAID